MSICCSIKGSNFAFTHLENTFENTLWLESPVLGAESVSADLLRLPPLPGGPPPSPVRPSTQVKGYERRFSICIQNNAHQFRVQLNIYQITPYLVLLFRLLVTTCGCQSCGCLRLLSCLIVNTETDTGRLLTRAARRVKALSAQNCAAWRRLAEVCRHNRFRWYPVGAENYVSVAVNGFLWYWLYCGYGFAYIDARIVARLLR